MDGNGKRPESRKPEKGWKDPLYERQPGETSKAFEGFATYRDLGPGRSLAETGRILGKTKRGTLEPWSVEWGWVERAQAWDDEADRNQRARDAEERAIARRRMLENHAKGGMALMQIGAAGLSKYDASVPAQADAARRRIDELSAAESARLMMDGAKLERLARGEATERLEIAEARAWVEGFIDMALGYIPETSHDAFLTDIEAKMGMGIGG